MADTTILTLPLIAASQAQKHVTHNEALAKLDLIVQLAILDLDLTAPPGSPVLGDRYIVGASATGDWATHDGEIAFYNGTLWLFTVPLIGWQAYVVDDANVVVFDGTDWTALAGGGGGGGPVTESMIVAVGDETTPLTTGVGKITFRMPYGFTLTAVRASLKTAQATGSIVTVDVNEAGASILSTKLTIDNTEKTSTTAATPAVISDAALADDAEITIDVDQVGDGTAIGLKVYLIGNQ